MPTAIEEARHIAAGFLAQAYRNRQPEKALEYWEYMGRLSKLHYTLDEPAAALARHDALMEAEKCLHD